MGVLCSNNILCDTLVLALVLLFAARYLQGSCQHRRTLRILKKMEQSTIHRNLKNRYYNETCEVLIVMIIFLDVTACN
jgi:hypothetical protein